MKYAYALAAIAALSTPAFAADTLSSLPPDSWTITNYYKQNVYDKGQNTVGKIDDVLVDKSGKITALMVGVGGFWVWVRRMSRCRSLPFIQKRKITMVSNGG